MKYVLKRVLLGSISAVLLSAAAPAAFADEGMWLFNRPPRKELQEKYGFEPTPEWLDHVRKSSVRFNSGGSGSFVSADGLVMTNHHVGADSLQKFGDATHNYLRDGFYAKTHADEKQCLDLELNVLDRIEDVTARVNAAVKAGSAADRGLSGPTGRDHRNREVNRTRRPACAATWLRCIRGASTIFIATSATPTSAWSSLPEQQTAFYGGDPDNFEYPRYDLDIRFFRVYEDGQAGPRRTLLSWSKAGAPTTNWSSSPAIPDGPNRLDTVAELDYLRDIGFPYLLQRLYRAEVLLSVWGERSDENARRAREPLFGVQNSRKARIGGLAGLARSGAHGTEENAEDELKAAVDKDPARTTSPGLEKRGQGARS